MSAPIPSHSPLWKQASEKESARLKAVQAELHKISERLSELSEEMVLSPETVKRLPKTYRSKSTWLGFETAGQELERAATKVSLTAGTIRMAINLAEIAETDTPAK